MSTILYMSNQLVQAVVVKGKKSRIVREEKAPEGSIVNGTVTDEEVFSSWIKNFFAKYKLPRKDCTLVINSTQFNGRILELPKSSGIAVRRMIAREFSDTRTENTVYAYHTLENTNGGKMQKVFAVSVEKQFLEAHLKLFAQIGIEISSIEPALSLFIKRFMGDAEVQKKNCIVQVMDGQEILSMLFVKGVYLYSQRNRIFSDGDGEMHAREAGAVIERLLQFGASQHLENPIETLFLCGARQEEMKTAIEENVNFTQPVVPRVYREEKGKGKKARAGRVGFVYPLGNIRKPDKNLNLVRLLRQENAQYIKKRERSLMLMPSIVVLVLCLAVTAVLGGKYISGNRDLNRVDRMMQSEELTDAYAAYELADANVTSMEQRIIGAQQIWERLMSYPTVSTPIRDVLQECAGESVSLELKNFNRDNGVLTLNAAAKDVRAIHEFIARLQEQEIFAAVEYSGYTLDGDQNIYSIHVICAMAEGVGRK